MNAEGGTAGPATSHMVVVARSKSALGPWENMPSNPLVHTYSIEDEWWSKGHGTIFDDADGNWYIVYHSYRNSYHTLGRTTIIESIEWTEDGWPLVLPERYGAVPQIEISADEIAGKWEHIDLSYGYREQKASATMTFGADGKISDGPWKGATWSFDPEKNVLKTSNGVTLYVSRECDWEASPRKATLVYAAIGKNKTYWGKKSN